MSIPYSTDSPLYHRPLTTVGLIIVNVLIFIFNAEGPVISESVVPYTLYFGDGLHPVQWLTNNFLHARCHWRRASATPHVAI